MELSLPAAGPLVTQISEFRPTQLKQAKAFAEAPLQLGLDLERVSFYLSAKDVGRQSQVPRLRFEDAVRKLIF